MEVGEPTLRFFLEGEEMEEAARRSDLERAQGFGNDNHGRDQTRDTLTLLETVESPLDRYERHARVRGTLIALALLTSLGAIGVAGWIFLTTPGQPAVAWLRSRVPALMAFLKTDVPADGPAARTANSGANAANPAPVPATETPPVPSAAVAQTAAAAPAGEADATVSEPAVQQAPTPAAAVNERATAPQVPAVAPVIESLAAAEPTARSSDDAATTAPPARTERSKALRGYVWSPSAKALVTSETSSQAVRAEAVEPVDPASAKIRGTADDSAARSAESPSTPAATGSMPAGPGIAAPSTGPAPDETARVPSTEPPPVKAAPAAGTDSPAAPIIE